MLLHHHRCDSRQSHSYTSHHGHTYVRSAHLKNRRTLTNLILTVLFSITFEVVVSMSSSASTTRMKLRRRGLTGSSDTTQDTAPAESIGAIGRSSENETKRAPVKKGQRKYAVEVKTGVIMTTRQRGKKSMSDDRMDLEGWKCEASTSKGRRGRGRKTGGVTEMEDLPNAKASLLKEEPMDTQTQSDPSGDEVQSQVELLPSEAQRKQKDKTLEKRKAQRGSVSHSRGKASSRGSKPKLIRGTKSEPEPLLKVENECIEQSSPTKKPRTKTSMKEDKGRAPMSNDVEMKVDLATNEQQTKKKSKGHKVVSKSNAATADINDIKSEPLLELPKTVAENSGITNRGKCVGAHCSIAGGLWNAVSDAVSIGAKSFALFLRSQRQWQAKPLEDDSAAKFREACVKHGYPSHLILPHGSYLLNCGSPNSVTLSKSRDSLVDELARCQKLGLTLYNFHPGSTCGDIPIEECLDKIGESINMALAKTSGVTAVIENMSRQGHTIGGDFEELRGIINRVHDKSRIGVCLDTCHAFAAGYDLSTESGFQKMMADFERIVGFQYLKGVHLNDSKGEVGCHRDRHENIGKGKIGLEGFRRVMNDPRFDNIPLILETPIEYGYAKEIKTLNSLVG